MKKLLSIIMCLSLIFTFAACSNTAQEEKTASQSSQTSTQAQTQSSSQTDGSTGSNVLVAYFKSKDSTRCVNYVSNTLGLIKNKKDDATLYGDVAMWNEYLGLWQPCNDIPGRISEVNKICKNKPLIITEFGLCEPHFSGGDERRKEILLDHIKMFNKADKIQGYVWFSLNDYRTHVGEQGEGKLRQRVHGSTDLYGNKKPSYNTLCEVNANQIEKHT